MKFLKVLFAKIFPKLNFGEYYGSDRTWPAQNAGRYKDPTVTRIIEI